MTSHKFNILGTDVELDDDVRKFTAAEMGAVERYTGMTLSEFGRKLADTENLSVLCWSSLAWISLRRTGNMIPYDAFMESVGVVDLINALSDGGVDVAAIAAGLDEAPKPVPNRAERRRATK
jgi:hypothetical protein